MSAPSARQVVLRNAGVPGIWTHRQLVMEEEKENFQRTALWYAREYWQSAKHTPACLDLCEPGTPQPVAFTLMAHHGSSIEKWDPGGLSELIWGPGSYLRRGRPHNRHARTTESNNLPSLGPDAREAATFRVALDDRSMQLSQEGPKRAVD